ncbi:phenylalanine--tRNA ligase subunit beta [Pseudobdellovibrio exovorus]|uniref:Phenylalanine--tRNA ligase beta subunit n=1 Tax=Pseudobdellovibrio exovorus JSS TaxID=1184267 RepID=M4VCE5_9BACT|nr:phenylalanine--tRNA ligase subunit beta [Pseudobdellovibrio exovorus]AGH95706.1 phenylalanyl-tRNA synthetase beta chain [Pseudobdellovibrio exovorus JSS]
MKISLKWLNDFIDVAEYAAQPQVLADILTKAGLEVEEIQDRARDFANVVVGHIQVKDKHPNADKLSLCQVEVAAGKVEQIVCGAQNHKAGDKVIVALPGAVLPGNFAIKKSKIRDVESNGMLCSYKELGMAETSDGIAILPVDAVVGQSFAEFSGLDDVTFELKVTPNRADCLSHYGLARELGCLLGKPVKSPEVLTKFASGSTRQKIKLEVKNTELCPRYCGRYIANVKVGPSPAWLVQRLEAVGQNSINNVVDITNYVMLEMGQPLHAFDADRLEKSEVQVRSAVKGETFKTLKEQDLTLSGEELLICDGVKAVALAGVIGGLNSGVSEATKNIFLESAFFNAMSTRKSSRVHGVETDSAYRFSRGVDPSSTATIMDRAALLIQQVAGGEVYGDAYDVNSRPQTPKKIRISLQTVTDRLGYSVDKELFLKFMGGLQIQVNDLGGGEYEMTPPLFRFDLEQDMDLVEEYARLHGYEHIQENIPALHVQPTVHDANYMLNQKVSQFLRAEGYNQAFNYAFTSDHAESTWLGDIKGHSQQGLATDVSAIKIRNPLSEELNVMRRSLSQGLWKNTLENIRSGSSFGALFEIGSVFSKTDSFVESSRLGLIAWGSQLGLYSSKAPLVYSLRSSIEKLLQSLNITAYSFVTSAQTPSFLHIGQWAQLVVEGQPVGYIGSVHPRLLDQEKVRVPVVVAELNLQQILKGQPRPLKFKSLSKFQPVERDFAFVMATDKVIGDLLKEAKKSCGALLKDLSVFDIYEGDKLPQGQKSVALRAQFQGADAALTDADIQQVSQKLIDAAKKSVAAELR